ncbi:MAG: hypothetical protein AAGI37_20900, partial [Planctomycetota bacterium]
MTKQLPSSKAKRRTIQSLVAVSAIGLGVISVMTQIDQGNPAQATQVQEPAEEDKRIIDVDTYYAMMRLRGELGFAHRDLSAAGCDTAATHAALTNLLDWYETN